MKAATTGVVMGAAVGVIAFILYLCALALSVQHIPDAASLLLGLQLASGFGAAAGGWIGVLVALLSPRGQEAIVELDESEVELYEPEPTMADAEPPPRRIPA